MKPSLADVNLLDQIGEAQAAINQREEMVRALLPEEHRFDRVRNEAGSLTRRYPEAEDRPPLYGMLVGVKDIFHVDGFTTRAGSRLPPEALQGTQARSVTRLRDAGALVLGKTVTTEFAYFSPGPTRNPHNLDHTPGGSSSGSAAAVASGYCALALGTQTIGSIIRPAAFCGVVGLKPSYDRISREGVIPLSPSFDHAGFFTRDIATAKRVAPVLYEDWRDSAPVSRKPVIGIPEGAYLRSASAFALERFEAACGLLAKSGYEVRRLGALDDFARIRARHDLVMSAEAARVHSKWFEQYEELYAPKTAELIRRGQSVSPGQLERSVQELPKLREELVRLMESHGINAFIAPCAPGPAPKGLDSTGDPVMNLPWTQAGLPSISLPAGRSSEGLPLGLQLVGGWYADEDLLNWAGELEKVLAEL